MINGPMDLPESWLKSGLDPKGLSAQAIDHDKWDREDLRAMLDSLPPFSAARRALAKFVETGEAAMSDTFWMLLKAEPEVLPADQMRPDHLVNRMVAEQAQTLDELDRLRRYSVNDDVQAALSCVTMEPELETLFDRMKKHQEQAEQLQEKLAELAKANEASQDLDEMVARWKADNCDEDGDGEGEDGEGEGTQVPQDMLDAQAKAAQDLADAQAAAEAAAEAFEEAMGSGQAGVRASLAKAMSKAADEAQEQAEAGRAWGLGPGELQRLDPKKRLELAKKLNSPRFKRIADLFGPMRNLMLTEQQRKTTHHKEELYDTGLGDDLGRVLPSEILNLREGPTRLDFLRRYSEKGLFQYELQGTEYLTRGAIILCEDGSSSMRGEREMWAKAVMLCLLHLARQQKRAFHLIHFGSAHELRHMPFVHPGDFELDRILEAAELFFNGGTAYQPALETALDLLQTEHKSTGRVTADVVFVTDGECGVQQTFMDEYLAEMKRMESTTWGIDVSGGAMHYATLNTMTEGKVATIKDLLSGEDVRGVFRGV